ncbi:MAG: sigma factor, partial [Rhodospirillaceae bacterium]
MGDVHLAEDLRQEVALTALATAPHGIDSLRAWLTTVSKNLARQWTRRESQRRSVERLGAREEATLAEADRVERARAHHDVAGEVLALREPYRTTIL